MPASADAAALLGAGVFRYRHLYLRRLRPAVPGLFLLAVPDVAGRKRHVRLSQLLPGFLEAAGMFCAPWLVNRLGAKNGLIFAGMVMAMRMVASGLVEGRC
jgi:hypothetical protein